jgi:hypothetical protein
MSTNPSKSQEAAAAPCAETIEKPFFFQLEEGA